MIKIFLLTVCALSLTGGSKIVCYYHNNAYWRTDVAKVYAEQLKPVLKDCSHLIYGFIGINGKTYQPESLDSALDLSTGKNYFKHITLLKNEFPHLKVLLSIGGYSDYNQPDKYLKVLESPQNRINFICFLMQMLTEYGFDGVDLAWQFPFKQTSEKSVAGKFLTKLEKYVTFFIPDDNAEDHKQQFITLCKELKAALKGENMMLSLTIFQQVNYKVYYGLNGIVKFVDQIHLMTHDYVIPERYPIKADYSAPLNYVFDRDPEDYIDYTVDYFLNSSIPPEKIIMSVPTYGRTWKLRGESDPPADADGPGEAGPYMKEDGLMAYYEICKQEKLTKVRTNIKKQGIYAYRLPNGFLFGQPGLWISYEDEETASLKAQYALRKGLGGVAISDLTLDDHKGVCSPSGQLFPIFNAVKKELFGINVNNTKKVALNQFGF